MTETDIGEAGGAMSVEATAARERVAGLVLKIAPGVDGYGGERAYTGDVLLLIDDCRSALDAYGAVMRLEGEIAALRAVSDNMGTGCPCVYRDTERTILHRICDLHEDLADVEARLRAKLERAE